MLNRIRSLFLDRSAGETDPPVSKAEALPLAAAVLMIEAAKLDDSLEEVELHRIEQLIRWRFELTEAELATVIGEARAISDGPAQWYFFTATIRDQIGPEDRVEIIEMLWDVAYADGELHHLEANLLRRIAGLLHVPDRDSGAARKRVMARYGLSDGA